MRLGGKSPPNCEGRLSPERLLEMQLRMRDDQMVPLKSPLPVALRPPIRPPGEAIDYPPPCSCINRFAVATISSGSRRLLPTRANHLERNRCRGRIRERGRVDDHAPRVRDRVSRGRAMVPRPRRLQGPRSPDAFAPGRPRRRPPTAIPQGTPSSCAVTSARGLCSHSGQGSWRDTWATGFTSRWSWSDGHERLTKSKDDAMTIIRGEIRPAA
jgi:hypothetical protein